MDRLGHDLGCFLWFLFTVIAVTAGMVVGLAITVVVLLNQLHHCHC